MFNLRCTLLTVLCLAITAGARAELSPDFLRALHAKTTPSLVAVQYTWDSEGGRHEIIGAGIVIGADGVVMTPLALFDQRIVPDEQMKDFKIIVPADDADDLELEAVFLGRDERSNLAFLRTREKRDFQPIVFEECPIQVGEAVASVGMLPKLAGYRTYMMQSSVAALLRGEIPQVISTHGLCPIGSPVFNARGQAIGMVGAQMEQPVLLNDPKATLTAIRNPPQFFVPARDFLPGLARIPQEGKPAKMPWVGLPQLTGLKKEVAEFFGLKGQVAIELGDIIPNSPGDKAGLKRGQIIVKVNKQPLERGDNPSDVAGILRRRISRMEVGQQVVFSVLEKKDQPLKEITVTLEERPMQANLAARFYAEDLGFTARQMVLDDTYSRKLPADTRGVVVAFLKPQSAAQTARLQNNDMVTEINNTPVTSLEQFKQVYQDFRATKPREAVVLVVTRESNTQVIRIEPPQ